MLKMTEIFVLTNPMGDVCSRGHKKNSPRDIKEDFFSVILDTLRNMIDKVSNCSEFFPYLAQNGLDSTVL